MARQAGHAEREGGRYMTPRSSDDRGRGWGFGEAYASPHFKIPSYIEYITAAFGTTRIICALNPP